MNGDYSDILDALGRLRSGLQQARSFATLDALSSDAVRAECERIDQLLAATPLAPSWWDENGAPRFAAHHPDLCPDKAANEVALLLISCQSCGREFRVQMSWSMMDALKHELVSGRRGVDVRAFDITLSALESELHARNAELGDGVFPAVAKARDDLARRRALPSPRLDAMVADGTIHYGDPPNVGCCPAGPTMNCWDLRVIEFWERGSRGVGSDPVPIADAFDSMKWRRRADLEIELPDLKDDERERV